MSSIKEMCENVSFNRINSWRNISNSKLNTAISNLGIRNDEVILFYDSSLFENGKNGLAICESGIYWKDAFCQPRFLNWNMFRKSKLSYDKSNIYFGDNGSFFVFETEIESLMKVLQNLRIGAKVENFVEKTVGILSFVERAVNFINDLDTNNNNNRVESQNEPLMISGNTDGNRDNDIIEVESFKEIEDLSQWTIAAKGVKFGPYTTEQVKTWLSSNKNKYEKLHIWKKGMANWELVSNIPEFIDFVDSEDDMPPLPMFD